MKPQDFSASHETAPLSTSAGFALRILRGWHAGAQITVPPGETLRVGGQEACDIVLTDDAVAQSTLHIRLAQSANGNVTGWQLALQGSPTSEAPIVGDGSGSGSGSGSDEGGGQGDEHGDVIPFDTPRSIGQLTVTVSRADAPWPAVHLPDDLAPSEAGSTAPAPAPATVAADASTTPENGGTVDTASATHGGMAERDEAAHAVETEDDADKALALGDVTADATISKAMDPANRDGALPGSADQHGRHRGAYGDAASSRASLAWLPAWLPARLAAWLATRFPARFAVPASSGPRPGGQGAHGSLRGRLRRALGRDDGESGAAASAGGVSTPWLMAAGALAIIAALVAMILVVPRQAPPPLAPSSPIAADGATQVQHALRAGGWIDGIRVDLDADGRVTVAGWVLDEAARDRLSATLARLTPMPAMRIAIVADALQAARDTAAHFGPFLTVDGGRIGEIRLRGVILPPADTDALALTALPVATASASSASATSPTASATVPKTADAHERDDDPLLAALRTALRAAIAAAVPNATLNDAGVVTAEGAVNALGGAVIAAGLPKAGIHWERIGIDAGSDGTRQAAGTQKLGQLVVDAPMGTDATQLQRTLDGFRQRYGDRIPIRTLIGGSRATFTPALLPFSLVAISSGLLPSVVVDGNVRLLPGGSYRGYRLVFVDDATVVFDRETAPGTTVPSQRIVLQR